uniref:Uncharacterized protein n=1 Tax=Setaria digitata TaxID=48799 RepID=A0A915Q4G8_9BILA
MFVVAIVFATLSLLYAVFDFFGRKSTIKEIRRKAVIWQRFGEAMPSEWINSFCRMSPRSCSSINRGRLYAFQMDVTDDDSVRQSRRLVDAVLKEKNLVLHALINNAGKRGNIFYDDFLRLEDYKEVWDVNMLGVIRVTHAFRDLIKKSRGRIVICNTGILLFALPTYGPYASSKYALHGYTDVIRHELQPYGVEVIELVPGSFETGMQNMEDVFSMIDVVWHRASQELRDEVGVNYDEKAKAFYKHLRSKVLEKDTTWVIDAYYEAIVARRPKLLYRIGWDVIIQ